MVRNNPQQCQSIDTCPHMADAAEKAADHAVKKVFAILGVDVQRPESVEEFREDLRFGKRMRRMADHGQLANYAIVEKNKVINTCTWDGVTEWQPPVGSIAVEIAEGVVAGVGFDYIDGQFIAPPLPDPILAEPEDPLAALTLEQKQALIKELTKGLI